MAYAMRAVVQRVTRASVQVDNATIATIERGLLIYLGVGRGDLTDDAETLATQCANLRIFAGDDDKMRHSVRDLHAQALVVSQFTLYADTSRGNRPSFSAAESPERARTLYDQFCHALRTKGIDVSTGQFAAMMTVSADVDGPVTILLDTRVQA